MLSDTIHIRLLIYHFMHLEPAFWHIPDIQSGFWRFYMNRGEGAFLEHQSGIYPLHSGRLYLVPAGVRFATNLTAPVEHFYVHFDLLGLPALAHRELFATPISLPPTEALEQKVSQMADELARHAEIDLVWQFRIKAVLYEALTLQLRSLPPEQVQRSLQLAQAVEPVMPALVYIESHLSEHLLSNDLARLCHMNPDYFIRRFRECIGQTPGQYIQEQRVKRAERQLLLTDDSIEQIAAAHGFGSRFYFTRVFTRHTGIAPVAYRKGLRIH